MPLTPIKILIVEDCATDRELLKVQLHDGFKQFGIPLSIVEAICLEAALQQTDGCDVVMLDLGLLTTTTHETQQCICAFRQPVVIVSSHEGPEIVWECMKYGATAYLSKNDASKCAYLLAVTVIQAAWRRRAEVIAAERKSSPQPM